jgi:hypothetical protein
MTAKPKFTPEQQDILKFEEIAGDLCLGGKNPKGWAKEQFKKHKFSFLPGIGATRAQFENLFEAITCSTFANEESSINNLAVLEREEARRMFV